MTNESTKIFGVPLSDVMKRPSQNRIPTFIKDVMRYLLSLDTISESLFRIETNTKALIERTKMKVDQGEDFDTSTLDPQLAAGLLRLYFKELPEPLLSFHLYQDLLNLLNHAQSPSFVEHVSDLLMTLPKANRDLFEDLLGFLEAISDNNKTKQSSLTTSQLGIAFGPVLFRPGTETIEIPMNAMKSAIIAKFMIENHKQLFKEHSITESELALALLDTEVGPDVLLIGLKEKGSLNEEESLVTFKREVEDAIVILQRRLSAMAAELTSSTNLTAVLGQAQRVREAKRRLFGGESGTHHPPQSLSSYKLPKAPINRSRGNNLVVRSGYESLQGKRKTMEDTHMVIDDFNSVFPSLPPTTQCSFYAVYDGHAGSESATIAGVHLHRFIVADPAFNAGDVATAIRTGIRRTDEFILESARAGGWKDGSTAVFVLLVGSQLYVANLGDSEAVLGRRKRGPEKGYDFVVLSEMHKPTNENEKQRIEAAGGQIFGGRVFGSLAVSRALGDAEYKLPINTANFVSAEPYIAQRDLIEGDEFLIVACDGLWDKITYQDAVDFVGKSTDEGLDPKQTSCLLAREAIDRGSTDNVTVVVVFFKWN
eukprot:TRINITY_DN4944_c0_g1_i1.p1 TRINITY_DN4944_c0_g1~~TRINITY_DN4944_c0_g1_i1.p1  ORF type:complete len:596 (-),score=106.06 TRINITY_DN4944_c0_g1_i1:21-1808(-)